MVEKAQGGVRWQHRLAARVVCVLRSGEGQPGGRLCVVQAASAVAHPPPSPCPVTPGEWGQLRGCTSGPFSWGLAPKAPLPPNTAIRGK